MIMMTGNVTGNSSISDRKFNETTNGKDVSSQNDANTKIKYEQETTHTVRIYNNQSKC